MFFNESWLFNILSIIASVVVIIVSYFKWTYGYWYRRGVPTPETYIPYGNAKNHFRGYETAGQTVAGIYQEYKAKGLRYCGYYLLLKPILILIDLDLIRTVMSKDFASFTDRGLYTNEKVDPLTGSLLALKGSKWRVVRTKLSATFSSGKMKMMFPTLLECLEGLIDVMDEVSNSVSPIEMKDIIARFATDIIGTCAFGIDCNSLKDPNSEFRILGKKACLLYKNKFLSALKLLVLAGWPALMHTFKIRLYAKEISDFFIGTVRNTFEYREKNGIVRKDFMHLLIQLKNNVKVKDDDDTGNLFTDGNQKSGNALTIEEATAQAYVFFLGGFETASTTLPYFFYELARDQELQERVRAEVRQFLEAHDGKLTYDALVDMSYMEMCIKETLRKYPPLPILTRDCTADSFKVPNSDLVLKRGSRVFVSVLGIHYDPEIYPDPEKFDPERFNQKNKSSRHPFSFLAFGEGPRSCIGERFGIMEMKVCITTLLNKYKFTVNEKTAIPLVIDPFAMVPYPKSGIWLNTEKI